MLGCVGKTMQIFLRLEPDEILLLIDLWDKAPL